MVVAYFLGHPVYVLTIFHPHALIYML